jgi:hypothetical protein
MRKVESFRRGVGAVYEEGGEGLGGKKVQVVGAVYEKGGEFEKGRRRRRREGGGRSLL